MRRQMSELMKEKAVLEERACNAETKLRDSEEKKSGEAQQLQLELFRQREAMEALRKRQGEELTQLRSELSHCENERADFRTTLERERLLSANKIRFIEEQKESQKK